MLAARLRPREQRDQEVPHRKRLRYIKPSCYCFTGRRSLKWEFNLLVYDNMDLPTSTCTVVHIAIDTPDSKTIPVLLEIDDPEHPVISLSVAQFARYLQREGIYSYEKIRKAVAAIGKLRDFYLLVKKGEIMAAGGMKSLLEDFLFSVDHGNALKWRPTSNSEYSLIRSSVLEYVKFLMDTSTAPWPETEQQFIEACRASMVSTSHAEKSLLFHTKKRVGKKARGRKKALVGLRQYKPFPLNLVTPLIETTANVRDKLLFSLLAFGGRRISELLHLFLMDVGAVDDGLAVQLHHPGHTPMEWRSRAGAVIKGPRREYLKEEFNLLPRTEHGAQSSFAGWKGMKFDNEATLTSNMYFIRGVERYLLTLHQAYLHSVRAQTRHVKHPYYFVAADGTPLTIKAVEKQFSLACRRLEKKLGISLKGYGPHSLRHSYGFYCADVLKADLLLIQKWMGHTQPASTAVYAHITPETAATALAHAGHKAALDGRVQISDADRAQLTARFARTELDPIPEKWKLTSTSFGALDTRKLTRKVR